jgi:Tfp pilus assembly protein PilF
MSETIARRRASRQLRRFAQQQNGDMRLAQHAALPVVLSPELLHLIRINFLLDEKSVAPPPFTAEVDLLLSPLCHEIGDDLYEINPEAREILLGDLVAHYGSDRLHEVASLLWQYCRGAPAWIDRPGLNRAQQLTALNILSPQQAAAWLDDARAQAGADAQADEEWFTVMRREHTTALAALNSVPIAELGLDDEGARTYEYGINALAVQLLADGELARQLAVYAERLRTALAAERKYGATSTTRAEREAIVEQIDTLARTSVGLSFEELCTTDASGQVQTEPLTEEQRAELLQLRDTHQERLWELERQQATLGINAPPHTIIEIQNLHEQLVELDIRLQQTTPPDDPERLHELLALHRRSLNQLLTQQARFSGSTQPLSILSDIEYRRDEIRRIKEALRAAGAGVTDHPDDEAAPVAETKATSPDVVPSEESSEGDTILQLGIEAAREKRYEDAHNLFALLTRQEPDNAQAWLWLAGVAQSSEERRAALDRVLELDPTNQMAITALRNMGVEVPPPPEPPADDFKTIEGLLDGGPVRREPTRTIADGDTILQLGIEAAREGNREEARNLFGLLTRQEPDSAQAWLWLAGVADGPEQRRAALERVLELDPTNEMAIKGLQAMGLTVPEAQQTSTTPNLALTDEELAVLRNLGVSVGRGTPEQTNEGEGDTILQLGIEAAREGNREEARNLFRLLVRQQPNSTMAWLWLAGVAESAVQRSTALKQALELDPTNEMALKGLQAMGISTEPVPSRSRTTAAPQREMTEEERYAAELDAAFDDYDALPTGVPSLGETFTGTILSFTGNTVRVEIPGVSEFDAVGELEVSFARRLLMRKGSSVRVTVVASSGADWRRTAILKLKLA